MNTGKSDPQLKMETTVGGTEPRASINQLPGPGEIVNRLGQQFQLPRAAPDAAMGERGYGGNNLGEIG